MINYWGEKEPAEHEQMLTECAYNLHILLSEVLRNSLTLLYYSPTGAHVEWCKQLIAATMSSPISGSISSETISRECKVCVS